MVFLKPPNPCLVTVQAPKLADAPSPAVEAILRVAPPPQRRISGMTAWAKSAGDLAFSAKRSPEVCYYPDSGKYGAYLGERNEDAFIAKGESAVDSWLDETIEPPPAFSPESGD